jgi:23S rRNA (pseudouridine1915-N3)-methyltransferase
VKVTVAVVGRLREAHLVAAEADYRQRLTRYCTFALTEHRDEAALLAALPAGAHLYALDERGDLVTSEGLAREILGREEQHGGGAPVVFAIGGADGHSPALRARTRRLLAFGRITIAHRLVRLLLLEQLYRGFSILRGEPYHRA